MLKIIEGLPQNVLGVEASGKVSHEDYQKVLIPAAEAKMAHGTCSMLYYAGPQFEGFELQALWKDGAFGTKYWDHFKRIAVVTDSEGLQEAVTMFCPFFAGEMQVFDVEDLGKAKAWIAGKA